MWLLKIWVLSGISRSFNCLDIRIEFDVIVEVKCFGYILVWINNSGGYEYLLDEYLGGWCWCLDKGKLVLRYC